MTEQPCGALPLEQPVGPLAVGDPVRWVWCVKDELVEYGEGYVVGIYPPDNPVTIDVECSFGRGWRQALRPWDVERLDREPSSRSEGWVPTPRNAAEKTDSNCDAYRRRLEQPVGCRVWPKPDPAVIGNGGRRK